MNVYTIILSLGEGTYIRQVIAPDEKTAMFKWFDEVDPQEVDGLTNAKIELLKAEMEKDYSSVVPLNGLMNAFCATCSIEGDQLFVFNLIKTAD